MDKEFDTVESKDPNGQGWQKLYYEIRKESNHFDYTCNESKKKKNFDLNRYIDVIPYDHSRVHLEHLGNNNDYINANFVEVPLARRKYILTQGPLRHTLGHFWLMIWEQKSHSIIMLNGLVERNTPKCYQYWPLSVGQKIDLDVGLRVKLVDESVSDFYVIRMCLLTDMESKESRKVIQFHYIGWPDFGIPKTPASFLQFLFEARKSEAFKSGPPIVHCSAGIGRSGTFCLVDSCLVLIETEKSARVTIKDVLLEMRKYRMGLIQTWEQLRFSYEAIAKGAEMVTRSPSPTASKDSGFIEPTNNDLRQRINKISSSTSPTTSDQQREGGEDISTKPLPTITNNNVSAAEVRERERQERKRKTQEHIHRIKERQRQQEERSRFETKLVRLSGIGLALIVGAGLVYSYMTQGSNFEPSIPSASTSGSFPGN